MITALSAPIKGFQGLTATPSVLMQIPFEVAKILPSALKVVNVKAASATFFTAEDCAKTLRETPNSKVRDSMKFLVSMFILSFIAYI